MIDICDLVPEMMKMLEPIQRVAQTPDSTPLIEPHPNKPEDKPKLTPEHFTGHLIFDNVKFTYPTERQKPVPSPSTRHDYLDTTRIVVLSHRA